MVNKHLILPSIDLLCILNEIFELHDAEKGESKASFI